MNRTPISVIVLTYNEEKNIEDCLKSVYGWADEIFIVDSYSTDKTREIAREYTEKIYQHKFEGYPHQRNWALDRLPYSSEWVFFLDADERPSKALKSEISNIIPETSSDVNGFYIKRKFIFMGKWIKHGGYYPVWLLRLFKHKFARCHEREVDEHFIVEGNTLKLQYDIIHNDKRGITYWIDRHNIYATLDALEHIKLVKLEKMANGQTNFPAKTFFEKRRLLKKKVWLHLPMFLRPFISFFYCYILRGGFLEGKAGFIYMVLLRFWYPLLVDIRIGEIKRETRTESLTTNPSAKALNVSEKVL